MAKRYFGKDGFIWWKGVVEDRKDPLLLGRCRVRIFGWHTDQENPESKQNIPTEELPWAVYVAPPDDGNNIAGFKEGDWVCGFFFDGEEAQRPCIMGKIHGIPEDPADPNKPYNDPTTDDNLVPELQPRPPSMSPIIGPPTIEDLLSGDDSDSEGSDAKGGRFGDPSKLPGTTTAFGDLIQNIEGSPINPTNYKFDVNNDGIYDEADAELIAWDVNRDGQLTGKEAQKNYNLFVGYFATSFNQQPMSRYPLESQLNEPTISRLARNEKIEETIVALKRGELASSETANFEGQGFGTAESQIETAFGEPETPYNAIYPFNHVYESESGHVLEIDDTPNYERLHRYHRSGTFEEIHPSGLRVDKTVDDQYNITNKNFYHYSGEESRLTAGTSMRLKALDTMVQQSGASFNIESGGSYNLNVGEDKNVVIKGDGWTFIGGENTIYIENATKVFIKDKLSIKAEGDIAFESGGNMMIKAAGTMHITSEYTGIVGPGGGKEFDAWRAETAAVGDPAVPEETPEVENDAEAFELVEPTTSTIQPGFILDAPKSGALYKPISEGDGNLVCLSDSGPIKLYHAIPTGELEQVDIQYLHEDLSITTWTVIRPVHIWEDEGLIEEGIADTFEDGRALARFSKPGKDYPKQMLMVTGDNPEGWLILDSAIRHD